MAGGCGKPVQLGQDTRQAGGGVAEQSTHRMCSRQQALQNVWPQSMVVASEPATSHMQTMQETSPPGGPGAALGAAPSSVCGSSPARLYTSSWLRSAMVPAAGRRQGGRQGGKGTVRGKGRGGGWRAPAGTTFPTPHSRGHQAPPPPSSALFYAPSTASASHEK